MCHKEFVHYTQVYCRKNILPLGRTRVQQSTARRFKNCHYVCTTDSLTPFIAQPRSKSPLCCTNKIQTFKINTCFMFLDLFLHVGVFGSKIITGIQINVFVGLAWRVNPKWWETPMKGNCRGERDKCNITMRLCCNLGSYRKYLSNRYNSVVYNIKC